MDKIKNILKKITDVFNEHWIWKTIILFLPSIYLPIIVKYWGDTLQLVNENDNLTIRGLVTTISIYIIVLLINILSSYKSTRDKVLEAEKDKKHKEDIEEYKSSLGLYILLMEAIGNICDKKCDSISYYINSSIKKKNFSKPFNETVYPDN